MAARPLPDLALVHKLLIYKPKDQSFWWRERDICLFKEGNSREARCATWNNRYAGARADRKNPSGYRVVTIFARPIQAHRLIWFLEHGEWPIQIDHINGVRDDNRLENLRNVTPAENARNLKLAKNNTSGYPGVVYRKNRGVWTAVIGGGVKGQNKWLGYFPDKDDAIAARKKAERDLGYHENHGR